MKQLWRVLGILIVFLAGLAVSDSILADYKYVSSLQQPVQGSCDELQLVFVVDQSGSMSEEFDKTPPSDPDGLRFYAPEKAVETLNSLIYKTYRDSTIRIAMIYFGDKPKLVIPWTVLTATNRTEYEELQQDLAPYFQPVGTMGNTNVLAAFQSVSTLFDQAPPQTGDCPARVVVVVTDGKPYLRGKDFSWNDHMEELKDYVHSYMKPTDHQIYVIGIDKANNYWDSVKPYWDAVTGDSSKVMKADDQAHMASLIIGIVQDAASSLRIKGAEAKMECVAGSTITIPPFIQEIRLTLVKPSPELHLDVLDENGLRLDPSRSDISVVVEGHDEPIETLTVYKPQPGIWTIQTVLPVDAISRCQISKITFDPVAQIISPDPAVPMLQFKKMPISLQIVDSSGVPLPDYKDPIYSLDLSMGLSGPSQNTQPIPLNTNPEYKYDGEIIPLEAGPNSLQIKALSHDPNGNDYVVFDKTISTIQVTPVRFLMVEGPDSAIPQHVEVPLKFAFVDTNRQPVQIDLPADVSAQLLSQSETISLPLTIGQDGAYQVTFYPDKAERYTIEYKATADTPDGSVTLGEDKIIFDVFPTKQVGARIVSPQGEHFVATDMFMRSTGLPMEIQLVLIDENGNEKEIGPGEVGASDPMSVFELEVLDEKNDPSSELTLVNTGRPGLFRLDNNTLGPGQYEVIVKPGTELNKDYVWANESWTKTVKGDINPLFFVLLGAVLASGTTGTLLILGWIRARKHPLSGYIEVFEKMPDADEGKSYPKPVIRRNLPKRNKVVITPSVGIKGFIERLFHISLAKSVPIKRIKVTCSTEEDSKAGMANVEVVFKDGDKFSATVSPVTPAVPLKFGHFVQKGPRKDNLAYSSSSELPNF